MSPTRTITLLVAFLSACSDQTTQETEGMTTDTVGTGTPTTGPMCMAGTVTCNGTIAQMCGSDGFPDMTMPCAVTCIDGLGCADCTPDSLRCNAGNVESCNEQGEWVVSSICNQDQGIVCDNQLKTCSGDCLPEKLLQEGHTHIGCEFFAASSSVNTPNNESLAIFVSNPGDQTAVVRAGQTPWLEVVIEIEPSSSKEIVLPWDTSITSPKGKTVLSHSGAAHIQSTQPVVITQHNPVWPSTGGDASLLIPVTSWGTNYVVASYSGFEVQPGIYYEGAYVIVGSADGTQIDLTPHKGAKIHPGAGLAADGGGKLIINQGDILQVLADGPSDLTGTLVKADRPVQVFGVHRCAEVPSGVGNCEHLEEAMLPVSALGRTHVLVPPATAEDPTLRREQIVRIVATKAGTSLTFNPVVAPMMTLSQVGDFTDIGPVAEPFVLISSAPVLVAQYMLGSAWDGSGFDPSMSIAVPVESFATSYPFHTVQLWPFTDVDIVAASGSNVSVDGTPIASWKAISNSGFSYGHFRIGLETMSSAHLISATSNVGSSVYSIGPSKQGAASYWHAMGFLYE